MPKEWLGEGKPVEGLPKPLRPSSRSMFSDPQYDSVKESGVVQNPEHEAAIKKAMGPLYGGLVGSRCDPVEEWPSDADELYGIPKRLREGINTEDVLSGAYRDDEKRIVTDKGGDPDRRVANSDLSGAGDRISDNDDFAERNQQDDDDSFTTHH